MNRILSLLLALTLLFTFGCSALPQKAVPTPTATPTIAPTPEPTPIPTPPPPEGLSSQPFDFIENTFAIWRVVRHAPVDGTVQYDILLLAKTSTIYCSILIRNNGATGVQPSYTLELIKANGDAVSSTQCAIQEVATIADFASSIGPSSGFAESLYVLSYSFELPAEEPLPQTAELSYPDENAFAAIDFANPILIDAES